LGIEERQEATSKVFYLQNDVEKAIVLKVLQTGNKERLVGATIMRREG